MASELTSPAGASADRTLADVLIALRAADLSERRRLEIASALRMIARGSANPPNASPANRVFSPPA
jgi:hypothetical protein